MFVPTASSASRIAGSPACKKRPLTPRCTGAPRSVGQSRHAIPVRRDQSHASAYRCLLPRPRSTRPRNSRYAILREEIDRIAEQRDLLRDATRYFLGACRDSLMTPTLREGITDLADTLVYVDELERAHRSGR
jgi:hypothetical protein